MIALFTADVAKAGKKAQNLARLLAAGLPVLDGCVLLPDDAIDAHAIANALGAGPYVVRSSSTLEDRAGASAAGLYASLANVAPKDLVAAIESVRASANDDAVAAYLAAHGATPRAIAVLVQPDVGAVPLGVAESGDDAIWVEERNAGAPEWADTRAFVVARNAGDPLAALVAAAERVLDGPVSIEYARGARLLLLQARPRARRHESVHAQFPPGRWRLDAEHNPDPLSTAQAELVALVDGSRFGPRLRVIDGYLYVREGQPTQARVASADRLQQFTHGIEPKLRAKVAAADGKAWPYVRDTYVWVARTYAAEIRASAAHGRAALDAILSLIGERFADQASIAAGAGGTSIARDAALYRLGQFPDEPYEVEEYLAQYGAYAPAWDVAAACDDEDRSRLLAIATRRAAGLSPERVRAETKRRASTSTAALRARLPAAEHARFDAALRELRDAIEMTESDDRIFFEAQRLVRRYLLRRGDELVREGRLAAREQIFDLSSSATGDLRTTAEKNRNARKHAAQMVPPTRIVDRRAFFATPAANEVLRGRGLGGRARGTAFVHRALFGDATSLAEVPNGAVLVLPAALPSLAPHLSRLSALVTEHGGALSHAATLAREYGLPAVVGCAGALDIPPGASVLVDGETGRVFLL